VDLDGFIVQCNRQFLEILGGYTFDEVRRLTYQDITPREWHDQETRILREQVDPRGYSDLYEKEYFRKDGTRVPIEIQTYANRDEGGNLLGYWALVRDITARKKVRSELMVFKEALDNASDTIGMATPDGRHYYQNKAFGEMFGDIGDRPGSVYVDPGVNEDVFRTIIAGGRWDGEARMYGRDGSILDVHLRAYANRDDAGRIVSLVGVHTDITEQKRAERELRDREHHLRTVIENVDLVFFSMDRDGVFLFSEGRGLVGLGLVPGQVVGQSAFDVYAGAPEVIESVKRAISGEQFSVDVNAGPLQFEVAYSPVRDANGAFTATIGVAMDMTGRRKAEAEREKLREQLSQARRMESIGRLAGGIAHDFNNMLSVILGHAEIALERAGIEETVREDLRRIHEAAERSADLTRQLLAFARRQPIAPRILALNDTVAGMVPMLKRLIGEDVALTWIPCEGGGLVRMDPSQIDQVLVNLCVNARDAIGGTGRITIETGVANFDDVYCADHPDHLPGDYVLLAVTDTGRGMDEATRARLFEPFFTTKEMGSGIGLGLATVYGVVRQNDGFIHVYSEADVGSTFRIYLPRLGGSWAETAVRSETSSHSPGGGETILLVEDEPLILDITSRMLDILGYRVIAVANPEQALNAARQHPGELHLLLTDVIMPGMNGRDLARDLATIHPGMKRLFMSGYTANVIEHHGVLDPGVRFLQKPFSLKELSDCVREALDDPALLGED
jgi:PAS domain S-box-containing protein